MQWWIDRRYFETDIQYVREVGSRNLQRMNRSEKMVCYNSILVINKCKFIP